MNRHITIYFNCSQIELFPPSWDLAPLVPCNSYDHLYMSISHVFHSTIQE
nr:6542_t:CDS:2 [Entrophospora candida]